MFLVGNLVVLVGLVDSVCSVEHILDCVLFVLCVNDSLNEILEHSFVPPSLFHNFGSHIIFLFCGNLFAIIIITHLFWFINSFSVLIFKKLKLGLYELEVALRYECHPLIQNSLSMCIQFYLQHRQFPNR